MMNLGAIENYIFLEYVTYNKVLTREKKNLYILITTNETSLDNIR
jgi:hypothetical protein